MNNFQNALWDHLMVLVQDSEAFYFADTEFNNDQYRIFNYRLASYTEFCKPAGLECRGVMFEISGEEYDAIPIRLASMPMEKFFNLYENPFTMDLDLTLVRSIEDKADGSLISTFLDSDDILRVKSKGSLYSDQAVAATQWLANKPDLLEELHQLASMNYTVNMEWIGPENRIVLGYETAELRVLNVRSNETGKYLDLALFGKCNYSNVVDRWSARVNPIDPVAFVASIPAMQGIEGYVIQLQSGQRIKVKTTWYLALHHTKDSINSPRRLFEAVLEEATDDMKSMFHEDVVAMRLIQEMEDFVELKYNHMVDTVERFYQRNKDLDRKDYAILGQEELKGTMFFSLAMNKWQGKEFSYKDFLKSKWKQLGLKDEM